MNVLTRKLARVKACLCCKKSSPPYKLILNLMLTISLSFILWKSTPEGLVKSKLELWMQGRCPAMVREKEAFVGEEETWLMGNTTPVRLWIGRRRLIGCELVLALCTSE